MADKCPKTGVGVPKSSPDDGCLDASEGAPQFPRFAETIRPQPPPPWNVAGVDYFVGLPSATTLRDPTTSELPNGCSYRSANRTIECKGDGIVIKGYDFSLFGGLKLDVTGHNISVTESKVRLCAQLLGSSSSLQSLGKLQTRHFTQPFQRWRQDMRRQNKIWGGNLGSTIGSEGALDVRYNDFANTPQI